MFGGVNKARFVVVVVVFRVFVLLLGVSKCYEGSDKWHTLRYDGWE